MITRYCQLDHLNILPYVWFQLPHCDVTIKPPFMLLLILYILSELKQLIIILYVRMILPLQIYLWSTSQLFLFTKLDMIIIFCSCWWGVLDMHIIVYIVFIKIMVHFGYLWLEHTYHLLFYFGGPSFQKRKKKFFFSKVSYM